MENQNYVKQNKFSDYLSILFKWKKLIIYNLIFFTLVSVIISFIIPEKFKSVATIMIEDNDNRMGAFGGMLSNVGSILGGGLLGSAESKADRMFAYLESRKLLEQVIDSFRLVDYYDIKNYKRDKTLKALKNDVSFDLTENGLLEISMIHKDPKISADIVNYFVKILEEMNEFYSKEYAKNYRKFVEKRYLKNLEDIAIAEEELETFQKKHSIYAIPKQFEIAFEAISRLETELALKELEKELLKQTQGTDNPNYRILQKQVELLTNKINNIEKGNYSTEESLIYLSLKDIPLLQKEYFRIYRNIEVQSKLLEYTLPIYEQAVMEEQKNIPTLVVLDYAVPPELKDSPKKTLIILSVIFITLFISILMGYRGELILTKKFDLNLIESKEKNFYKKIIKFYRIKNIEK